MFHQLPAIPFIGYFFVFFFPLGNSRSFILEYMVSSYKGSEIVLSSFSPLNDFF